VREQLLPTLRQGGKEAWSTFLDAADAAQEIATDPQAREEALISLLGEDGYEDLCAACDHVVQIADSAYQYIDLKTEEGKQALGEAFLEGKANLAENWKNPEFRKAVGFLEKMAVSGSNTLGYAIDAAHKEYEFKPLLESLPEPPTYTPDEGETWFNHFMENVLTKKMEGIRNNIANYVEGNDGSGSAGDIASRPAQEVFGVLENQRETARMEAESYHKLHEIASRLVSTHDKIDFGDEAVVQEMLEKVASSQTDYAEFNRELDTIIEQLDTTEEILQKIDDITDYIPGPLPLKIAKQVIRLSTGQMSAGDFANEVVVGLVAGKAFKSLGNAARNSTAVRGAVERLASMLPKSPPPTPTQVIETVKDFVEESVSESIA
jgi:hypothetical protein